MPPRPKAPHLDRHTRARATAHPPPQLWAVALLAGLLNSHCRSDDGTRAAMQPSPSAAGQPAPDSPSKGPSIAAPTKPSAPESPSKGPSTATPTKPSAPTSVTPASEGDPMAAAYAALERGDYASVGMHIEALDAAFAASPDDGRLSFYAGVMRLWRLTGAPVTPAEQLNDALTAIANLEAAVELNAKDPQANAFLGIAEMTLGNTLQNQDQIERGASVLDEAVPPTWTTTASTTRRSGSTTTTSSASAATSNAPERRRKRARCPAWELRLRRRQARPA